MVNVNHDLILFFMNIYLVHSTTNSLLKFKLLNKKLIAYVKKQQQSITCYYKYSTLFTMIFKTRYVFVGNTMSPFAPL